MDDRFIAYFSMEIALHSEMPTYAGGLGVLAGDTLRSAADAGLPMIAVSLLHRRGYLAQNFDQSGWQHALPMDWQPALFLEELPTRVSVEIEDRTVQIRAWRYQVTGLGGQKVHVFFLDSDVPENAAWDRTLTHYLYGGDAYYRLCQEIILGIGGVRMIRALGYRKVHRFHMNEGHSSLLTLELLVEQAMAAGRNTVIAEDIQEIKSRCIFTTHTPVEAAQDKFPMDLVGRMMRGRHEFFNSEGLFCSGVVDEVLQRKPGEVAGGIFRPEYVLNPTYLALCLSHYVNGVAKRHAEISRTIFAKYEIDDITNGIHVPTWTAPAFRRVFDRYIPGWQADNFSLRYAVNIPRTELWEAHQAAKRAMIDHIQAQTGTQFDPAVITLGFARRFTPYKRAGLLLDDLPRLRRIAESAGKMQIVYAGKAHPNDHVGKEIIQNIFRLKEEAGPNITIVVLANYNLAAAALLTSGCDVWVNTPLPPLEASGTSGMKAAVNGVPSLSILDGWWLEGCIEGVTGWAIGDGSSSWENTPLGARNQRDADSLYSKLEKTVLPLFYGDRDGFIDVMKHAIAINGSFFNTQRMIQQYAIKAYL